MMRTRHRISTLRALAVFAILVLCIPSAVFASSLDVPHTANLWPQASVATGISLEISWYASIPAPFMEDVLPLRTHLMFAASLDIVQLSPTPSVTLLGRLSQFSVSSSLPYGTSIWRPFTMAGPGFACTLDISDVFSLEAGIDLLVATYGNTGGYSGVAALSLTPVATLYKDTGSAHSIQLSLPLRLFLHPDHAAVSAGLSVSWAIQNSSTPGRQP